MPLEVTATGRPSSHASLTTAGGRATVSATSLSGGPAMDRLAGKVALISGGARGQGATETRLFVREGATVVFGDVLDDDGKKIEAAIRASGGRDHVRYACCRRLSATTRHDTPAGRP